MSEDGLGRSQRPDVSIDVPVLARVEGEGALHLTVRRGEVERAELRIFEPPRFFEAFLRGRGFEEPIDLTARICGICPAAYQMSASYAIERACGVVVPDDIRRLRRLLYCGEWIESHVLHIGFLHLPDFLGYPSGIALAGDHPDLVRSILSLKETGNTILEVLGGRAIHPVNMRAGGFFRAPTRAAMNELGHTLVKSRDAAVEVARFAAQLDFPDIGRDYTFVSLRHPTDYPLSEGRIVSSEGLDIDASEYEDFVDEFQVSHSTAKHATLSGTDPGRLHVGPLARYANNHDRLPPDIQQLAADIGLGEVEHNPFKSILVRGVETVYAIDEALRIIDGYDEPSQPSIEVEPRANTGWAATEAPRGLLYHRYRIDGQGLIADAEIIPPTAQNQDAIEADLREVAAANLHLDDAQLQAVCEQTIRNYDPCISCATHFLTVHVDDDGTRRTLRRHVVT